MSDEPPEDDSALFRAAMRGVRRIEPRARQAGSAVAHAPPPRARFARAARAQELIGTLPAAVGEPAVGGADRLAFRRPGVQEALLRKLRREQFPVQAELDLHGLGAVQAEAELRRFLGAAVARELRCVRIVHGKGHRSGERGPVLKVLVNDLLRRSPAVIAFVSAGPRSGGTGATCALLRTAGR